MTTKTEHLRPDLAISTVSANPGTNGDATTVSPKSTRDAATPSSQNLTTDLEETIRELAHAKWAAAGYPPGDGVRFWLEAEQALTTKAPQTHLVAD